MQPGLISLLQLLQLADSALPVGGAAHSFGLESLVDAGLLDAANLESYFASWLEEGGVLEAAYCAAGCRFGRASDVDAWRRLNREFAARKTARESREASAAMGRRFLNLAAGVTSVDLLREASAGTNAHLAPTFGFVAGVLGLDPEESAAAYLQQSVTTLLSCCQRLLPLGQTRAQQILWALKTGIESAVHSGASVPTGEAECFTPLLDIASARHPALRTRLFIS